MLNTIRFITPSTTQLGFFAALNLHRANLRILRLAQILLKRPFHQPRDRQQDQPPKQALRVHRHGSYGVCASGRLTKDPCFNKMCGEVFYRRTKRMKFEGEVMIDIPLNNFLHV